MMDPVSAVTGLILAGGAGQRMGLRDKASLRLGGVPMLEHTWHRLKPQTGVVMLAVHEDPVAFAFLGECSIVVDERQPRQGPLAGLEAALKVITTDWLLSVPVDVPFFPLNLAQRFFEAVGNTRQPAIAMNRGRTHPVVALWPRDILNKISQALDNNDRGLNYFLRHTPHCEVAFPDDKNGVDPFFNINTQQDLEQAEQWLIHWLGR